MSNETLDDAINNTLSAFRGCVRDDPGVERILNNIETEFSNIKPVILDTSLLPVLRNSVSDLYVTLDKAVIIARYIESFQMYVRVYKKDDIKSIMLCLKDLDTQFNTIANTVQEIKHRFKSI
jgi:hypothetical protein